MNFLKRKLLARKARKKVEEVEVERIKGQLKREYGNLSDEEAKALAREQLKEIEKGLKKHDKAKGGVKKGKRGKRKGKKVSKLQRAIELLGEKDYLKHDRSLFRADEKILNPNREDPLTLDYAEKIDRMLESDSRKEDIFDMDRVKRNVDDFLFGKR